MLCQPSTVKDLKRSRVTEYGFLKDVEAMRQSRPSRLDVIGLQKLPADPADETVQEFVGNAVDSHHLENFEPRIGPQLKRCVQQPWHQTSMPLSNAIRRSN